MRFLNADDTPLNDTGPFVAKNNKMKALAAPPVVEYPQSLEVIRGIDFIDSELARVPLEATL